MKSLYKMFRYQRDKYACKVNYRNEINNSIIWIIYTALNCLMFYAAINFSNQFYLNNISYILAAQNIMNECEIIISGIF